MNVYIRIRLLLHSLLFVVNFLTLIAAAWSITVARGGIQRVSPGAVLVLLGCIAYAIFEIILWIDIWIPTLHFSRVRTELSLLVMLIVFQTIGAAVATANLSLTVCMDQISCTSLLVLSWTSIFITLIHALIICAITYYHAEIDSGVWDALTFEYPWFYRPPDIAPPLPRKAGAGISPSPPRFNFPFAPQFLDTHSEQNRRPSSWMPSRSSSPVSEMPAFPREVRTSTNSTKFTKRGKWLERLATIKRGVELPFPVQSPSPREKRFENIHTGNGAPRIDSPAPPEALSFTPFERDYD